MALFPSAFELSLGQFLRGHGVYPRTTTRLSVGTPDVLESPFQTSGGSPEILRFNGEVVQLTDPDMDLKTRSPYLRVLICRLDATVRVSHGLLPA